MRDQSAIVNADLEVGLLPQIPENEIVELQLQMSEIPNLSDEQSELQCHNVDQKIHAIAAAIFLCGIGAFINHVEFRCLAHTCFNQLEVSICDEIEMGEPADVIASTDSLLVKTNKRQKMFFRTLELLMNETKVHGL
jgi:hypothetical protein